MRKLNSTILIGLAVALAGFVLVFLYGRGVDDKVADGRATKKVLVATQSLAGGLRADQLGDAVEVREVPDAYLASGYLSDASELAGKVLLGPVGKDAQLTATALGTEEQAVGVAPSKGKIALAVSTELTPGVARYIQAGSSVDMFVTYKRGAASLTKLFMSGVKVLSVEVAPVTTEGEDGDSVSTSTSSVSGVLAVVDVSPTDAEKIVHATTEGSVYLGLSALQGTAPTNRTPTGATADDVVRSNR